MILKFCLKYRIIGVRNQAVLFIWYFTERLNAWIQSYFDQTYEVTAEVYDKHYKIIENDDMTEDICGAHCHIRIANCYAYIFHEKKCYLKEFMGNNATPSTTKRTIRFNAGMYRDS